MTAWRSQIGSTFLAALVFALASPSGGAAPSTSDRAPAPVSAEELDQTIDEVINQREYTWRFPRDQAPVTLPEADLNLSWLERLEQSLDKAARKVGRWINDLIGWLKFNPGSRSSPGGGVDLGGIMRFAVFVLILALVGMIAWVAFKIWKQRQKESVVAATEAETLAVPDLRDETVGADQLPENEWITLARDLLQQGQYRLALRAYYLSGLAHLAERQLIVVARFKSNRDYERELGRRGHALPDVVAIFSNCVGLFERVWYGRHEISTDGVQAFARHMEQLKGGQTEP